VGQAAIARTREEIQEYPFTEEQTQETVQEEHKSWEKILWLLLGIVLLVALGIGAYKLADNFYLIRYKRMRRKGTETHQQKITRKSKWRKH
jgi:hypothetical protein